jgi:hypothetical protein
MSRGRPRRCVGVTDRDDASPAALDPRTLPSWVERHVVSIPVGHSHPYAEDEWRDALVMITTGELEIECAFGGRRHFEQGAILWLVGLDVRWLHNAGHATVTLTAIRRRR